MLAPTLFGKSILFIILTIGICLWKCSVIENETLSNQIICSENRFYDLFMNNPVQNYLWEKIDDDFVLADCNYAALAMTQGRIKKQLNIPLKTFYKDRPEIIDDINACYQSKQPLKRQIKYHYKTINLERVLEVTFVFIPPNFVMAHANDVSELQKMNEDLKKAIKAAEESSQAKNSFFTNMSHELRTPLNAILGYTEFFKDDSNLTNDQREGIDIIHRCSEHLLTLINDILDLSKIEAKNITLEKDDFPLSNFLNSIADMIDIKATQKEILFKYFFPNNLPDGVYGDRKRLRQILLNLLSNAVKFTDMGEVIFQVTRKNNTFKFQVEDTGFGIPHDQLDKIFLPFHQSGKQRYRIDGAGLGLSISQRFVQMMGGQIYVKSTEHKGSVFWFEIELPVVELNKIEPQDQNNEIIGYKGPRKKILIVDDNLPNRLVLKNILLKLDFIVKEAVNGKDALTTIETYTPDCIIMDVFMPELDGIQTTKLIRQNQLFDQMIIICISANNSKGVEQNCLQAGCTTFVAKPIRRNVFCNLISTYLNVEWIFEHPEKTKNNNAITDLTINHIPNSDDLSQISTLARDGDLTGLKSMLSSIRLQNDQFALFVNQVNELIHNFEFEKIEEIMKTIKNKKLSV